MQETESDINDGYWDVIRKRIVALVEWAKPNPEDPVYMTIFKTIYKSLVLLLLLALSPVILVILIIIFFATL